MSRLNTHSSFCAPLELDLEVRAFAVFILCYTKDVASVVPQLTFDVKHPHAAPGVLAAQIRPFHAEHKPQFTDRLYET
jgi:hypothetical protein